jgi:hypothetical protein
LTRGRAESRITGLSRVDDESPRCLLIRAGVDVARVAWMLGRRGVAAVRRQYERSEKEKSWIIVKHCS